MKKSKKITKKQAVVRLLLYILLVGHFVQSAWTFCPVWLDILSIQNRQFDFNTLVLPLKLILEIYPNSNNLDIEREIVFSLHWQNSAKYSLLAMQWFSLSKQIISVNTSLSFALSLLSK